MLFSLPGLEYSLFTQFKFDQIEHTGPIGSHAKLATFVGIDNRHWIVEQMLRNRNVSGLKVHPDRMVIHFFDRIGIPQVLAGVIHHVALHQTQNRGARRRVQAAFDVPDHVISGKVTSAMPLPLSKIQRPTPDIVTDVPAFDQRRMGDVLIIRVGQIFVRSSKDI